MQYFLTGGGDFSFFKNLDRAFDEALQKNDQVLILPYASPEDTFSEILERVQDTYNSSLKMEMVENINTLTREDFRNSRALYIEGGNTFDLITALRKANIETLLQDFLKKEHQLIQADSAGAIILGASVRTAFFGEDADDDEKRLQDYRGLDLLNGWSIHAHYSTEDDDTVMDMIYNEGTPILALHEETGIHIDESQRVKVLSEQPLTIFSFAGKVSIKKDQEISLSEFLT